MTFSIGIYDKWSIDDSNLAKKIGRNAIQLNGRINIFDYSFRRASTGSTRAARDDG